MPKGCVPVCVRVHVHVHVVQECSYWKGEQFMGLSLSCAATFNATCTPVACVLTQCMCLQTTANLSDGALLYPFDERRAISNNNDNNNNNKNNSQHTYPQAIRWTSWHSTPCWKASQP